MPRTKKAGAALMLPLKAVKVVVVPVDHRHRRRRHCCWLLVKWMTMKCRKSSTLLFWLLVLS